MHIVEELKEEVHLKKVVLREVEPQRPDAFKVFLELGQRRDSFELSVTFDHVPEVNQGHVNIVFDDLLPENRIPKHAISTECFIDNMPAHNIEEVFLFSVAQMLMESEETRLVLRKKGNRLIARLHLGAWETKGEIPFPDTAEYLRPA